MKLFLCATALLFASSGALRAGDNDLLEASAYEVLASGRLEQAERLFRQALEHDPESGTAIAGLGFIRMREWEFRQAEDYFEQAVSLSPGDEIIAEGLRDAQYWALMKEGDAAQAQDRIERARAKYRAAVRVHPEAESAHERLAALPAPKAAPRRPVEQAAAPAAEEPAPSSHQAAPITIDGLGRSAAPSAPSPGADSQADAFRRRISIAGV